MMKLLILSVVLVSVTWGAYMDTGSHEITIELKPLNKVLLCHDTEDQLTKLTKPTNRPQDHNIRLRWRLIDDNPNLKIEYKDVSSCEARIVNDQSKEILAVIAPKPLKSSSDIPMYFYNSPFMNDEDIDVFPNGLFPLRNHWQSLKHAFSHFMMTHGWKRMVIVSDDSYYSQQFEKVLIEHFKKKEFVFDAVRCVNTRDGRNFDGALKYIKENNAFIILVNIADMNAKRLAEAARRRDMLSSRYMWLVRDWPFDDVRPIMKLMISMTLSPYSAPNYNAECEHDGPNLNSVSRGLALISEAAGNVRRPYRRDYYYKAIYEQMNKTHKCTQSKAYIRIFRYGQFVDIKSIVIHDSGDIYHHYPRDPTFGEDLDMPEYCLVRSSSFKSPCSDTYIVLVCVVWLVFIITTFLAIFFFNRYLVWT